MGSFLNLKRLFNIENINKWKIKVQYYFIFSWVKFGYYRIRFLENCVKILVQDRFFFFLCLDIIINRLLSLDKNFKEIDREYFVQKRIKC